MLVILLTISAASAGQNDKISDKIIDNTKESYKTITDAPKDIKGNISVTDKDVLNYSIAKLPDKSILITRTEKKGEHTKANLKLDINYVKKLPGYNGKEIAYANRENGIITNYQVLNVKAHTTGSTVIVPATFSEVIISGMTGWYIKSVSGINPVSTTISFTVQNATGAYVQTTAPPTYQAWNESDINTYPTPSKWTLLWTLNGNSTGANDISGNNRHGTIVAAKTTTDRYGLSGKALYFDGTDDYISYNYTDTLYSNLTAFYGYKVSGYADDCITDLRTAEGSGRAGWYTHNSIYYLNNATTKNTFNSSSNVWNYAYTDVGSSQTNWLWLGVRYSLEFDYTGWLDVFGLYNGTLSATDRRQISMGYKGIKVKSNTGSLVPLTSSNQSISVGSTISSITLQSNNDTTRSFTFAAPFQQNYTHIRDWDQSSSIHRSDMVFVPKTNVTTGSLSYTLDKPYLYGTPSLSSNDAGSSVTKSGAALLISLGTITADTSKYYNVSLPIYQRVFSNYTPTNSTIRIIQNAVLELDVTSNGTTDIIWKLNGTTVETDSNTTLGAYTFSTPTTGDYLIQASVPGTTRQWIVTVYDISTTYPTLMVRNWNTSNNTCYGKLDIGNILSPNEWEIKLYNTTNGYNYSLIKESTSEVIYSTIAANNSSTLIISSPVNGTYYISGSNPAAASNWKLAIVLMSFFTFGFGWLYRRKQ